LKLESLLAQKQRKVDDDFLPPLKLTPDQVENTNQNDGFVMVQKNEKRSGQ
jgi:hypothetical protein